MRTLATIVISAVVWIGPCTPLHRHHSHGPKHFPPVCQHYWPDGHTGCAP